MQWVQISKAIVAMEYKELKCCGYSYICMDNTEMCEFHVDNIPDKLISNFEFKMSLRAPHDSLPIIIIGQDECMFSQFLLSSKMWMGPNKEAPLLPELEGEGHMISAFQSRDFGFGLHIPQDKLDLVNKQHHQ